MNIFTTFYLIIFLVLFSACEEKGKVIPNKEPQQEVLKDSVSPKVNSHESESIKKVDLTSKLAKKVARLTTLEHNYEVKNLDLVAHEKGMLLSKLIYLKKLNDSMLKDIDINLFKSNLHEVRKSFLKGTKPMNPNGNTYPRVHIEEYMFKTSESAKATYDMLKKSKPNGRFWMHISKSPYDLFLEENRIYFGSSGGFYMMGIYKDIFEKIKG
ncbi:hypothetical protein [Kordia jejudonensis]|uniref:hypothetical protein n=1 Tax=Kordia jejudonensis TaxID=1348245 RepID=UPI0006296259|nr:hypothetical protein [Kordia jejudonensis]